MDFRCCRCQTAHPWYRLLWHYNLLVDMGHNRLTDALTHLQVQRVTTAITLPSPTLLPKNPKNEFKALLSCFQEVVQPITKEQSVKNSVTHHITTTGLPVSADYLQNDSRWQNENLSSCCNKASFVLSLAIGLHHFMWYPRKHQGTIDHVEIIVPYYSWLLPNPTHPGLHHYITGINHLFKT